MTNRPLVLLLCGIAALTACDPGGPNGKAGILFFREERVPLPVGLSERVLLPRDVRTGGGAKGLEPSHFFHYDFSGTTLDATGADGLAVLGTQLLEEGWEVTVRCDAPAGPSELHVRVLAGAAVRYEDGYDIDCVAP